MLRKQHILNSTYLFLILSFNLVSLATNHTMDRGEAGVLASVNYWKNKKDIITSGQWSSWEDRNLVRTYEKNGIKYAFFSYTTLTNGLNTPYGKDYLNNVYSDSKAKNDIEKVKENILKEISYVILFKNFKYVPCLFVVLHSSSARTKGRRRS